ncbi:MAG: hypothetical protein L6R42_010537, partial [Xanthoria sp. 1 TBL-2021]
LKAILEHRGFIVLPSVLNPTQISSLRTACTTVRSLAESGQWPHLRTLPSNSHPGPPTLRTASGASSIYSTPTYPISPSSRLPTSTTPSSTPFSSSSTAKREI